jgi:hypothetical protein
MSDNTVTVSRSDPYSLDWVILKVLNTDETLFLKNAIQNLITKLNIQRTTYNNITGINCEQFDLFNHINDTSYGMPILKKIIAVVNDALVASKITTKKVITVSAVWTINGYENAFHEIHSHTPRNILFNKGRPFGISVSIYLTVPTVVDPLRTGNLYAVLQDRNKDNYTFSHHPEEGDVLIFPSWIYHGTVPQSPGLRQTLNFDFILEDSHEEE